MGWSLSGIYTKLSPTMFSFSDLLSRVIRLLPRRGPSEEPAVEPVMGMAPQIEYPRPILSGVSNEHLEMFRMLTGITSHPSMHHRHPLSFGTRPAPNLGIYARVVHNEQTAKRGHKQMSLLINGCLGSQIVVAAALTALGAAK